MEKLLSKLELEQESHFIDVGSSSGNQCITALASFKIASSTGIEVTGEQWVQSIVALRKILQDPLVSEIGKTLGFIHGKN